MADIPNIRMINLVDTPAAIRYDQFGHGRVPLDPQTGEIIDVTGFRRVSILVGSTTAVSCEVFMGKISGATLSMRYVVPRDGQIHTFDVVGPQMSLHLIGGQPMSNEKVQLWVYLRS